MGKTSYSSDDPGRQHTETDKGERALREISTIAGIGRITGSSLEMDQIYDRFCAEVGKLIPFDRLAINIHDVEKGMARVAYVYGPAQPGRFQGNIFPLSDTISGYIAEHRVGIHCPGDSFPFSDCATAMKNDAMESLMAIPLINRDEVIASLHFHSKLPDLYGEEELYAAQRICAWITGAIASSLLHADLKKTGERTRELSETNARLQQECAERQAVNESLRRREEEWRSLLDNSPDMILKTDPHLKIVWANRTAMEMNPHCVGIPCYRAFPGRDEICEGCPVIRAIETKHLERGVMYQPVSDTAPDEQYWENIGAPQFDEGGEVISCVEISRNITDLMQLPGKLEAANEKLMEAKETAEAANLAKSVFLANMSHELRTPLNAVLGFAQLMQNSGDATPEQRESLEIIARSGAHLLNLINNVLEISKIESGRMELAESPHDLHQMIQEIKSLMQVRAHDKGLGFTVEQARNLPRHVAVDGGRLRQVLLNLVGNAIKYTRQGTVTLRAMAIRQETGGQTVVVRFEVEDTGPGINREEQERIFAPFVRLGEKEPVETGAGLGLAISRQYVTLMGGAIGVAGEPGKGSIFSFEIPATELSRETMLDGPSQRGRVIGAAEGQPRYRLLIAEDQQENRLLLRKLLEPFGFDLREAVNGQEAVDLSAAWRPHLVWMDIRMPVMDGLEATRRIKAADARTRVVAITAHALEDERREILAAGCDDFIRKPYHYDDILDALTRHLGVRFIYGEEAAPAPAALQASTAALSALPEDLLRTLAQALSRLDVGLVQQAIEDIRTCNNSLAEALSAIARDLQFDRMLHMIRAALGEPLRRA